MTNKRVLAAHSINKFSSYDDAMHYLFPGIYKKKIDTKDEKDEDMDNERAMHKLADSILSRF